MVKTWIKKSFVLGMAVAVLAPSISYGNALQSYLSTPNSVVPLIKPSWGDFIIHADTLTKLYSQRGFGVIWVDQNGSPNALARTLKEVLNKADRHGLNPADYWDANVERVFAAAVSNPRNWITFELAASEALVRYATHLSSGRFDPAEIDDDIKFKKKEFNEFSLLNEIVSGGAQNLQAGLDRFMPNNAYYKGLMKALQDMKMMKDSGGWRTVSYPKSSIRLGSQSEVVPQLRARLRVLGYNVSDAGGNSFDAELDGVIREYQAKNGMIVDGVIGASSEVIRAMNYSVNDRIGQIQVNMEKLRWLPRNLEDRHIFINLATNEFRMQDRGRTVFDFKTISGQAFRRTPSMRDEMRFVDFNPTWTVPRSIAREDKYPLIAKNPGYLREHNMSLREEATGREVDPYSINWSSMTKTRFVSMYYIVQLPSFDNALGAVKFPLTNAWSIYLHDTNERALFKVDETKTESKNFKRHISSGCVRLEYPLELAAYVLEGNLARRHDGEDWSLDKIRSFVSSEYMPVAPRENHTRQVYLRTPVPVYMMNLTVELAKDGKIRFVHDVYGQDVRVADAIRNLKVGGELF